MNFHNEILELLGNGNFIKEKPDNFSHYKSIKSIFVSLKK